MNQAWDFLKSDGGRSALAIAAILISASVAIGIFLLNRKRKSLVYEYLSMTRLLSMKDEMSGRVRIVVDDVQVKDVGLVEVKIINNGTEPVRVADFIRPISFSVDEGVRIIEAEVSDRKPTTIIADLQKEDRRATLGATLLNSKNSLVIKLLIANFNGNISVDSRIEGVELSPREHKNRWLNLALGIIQTTPIVGAAVIEDDFRNDYKPVPKKNDSPDY